MVVGFHVGDLLFDELVICDSGAERFALISISDRSVAGGADDSGSARGHRESSLLQGEHSYLESFAFFPHEILLWNAHVLE